MAFHGIELLEYIYWILKLFTWIYLWLWVSLDRAWILGGVNQDLFECAISDPQTLCPLWLRVALDRAWILEDVNQESFYICGDQHLQYFPYSVLDGLTVLTSRLILGSFTYSCTKVIPSNQFVLCVWDVLNISTLPSGIWPNGDNTKTST